ncbi:type I methionyl aminopeptidase [Pampinifervens florentissimum]|uniref:type I methionyl aminopeptidase n=1 Tax=Pampinifervens florentissimum TaxID=1632019 RepID=UPI0013B47D76|nr:type I methionyl aminopeptidase [Hydrogenobacter sp. T-8]QID32894.1 type I methionyl aminopeptidase [Hydrogenobacter sp. T-8]
MGIELYSFKEIERIKRACDVVVEVLQVVAKAVRPGISTYELDQIAREEAKKRGAKPAFLNYKPPFSDEKFPASLCVSVNEAVVHGLPKREQIIKEGDIVSLDFGAYVDGYAGDSALTVAVGEISKEKEMLMRATKEALEEAVKVCVPGNWVSDIVDAIYRVAKKYGLYPLKNLGGHGIGRKVHEDPFIPNHPETLKREKKDYKLRQGMVVALEPMLSLGTEEISHDGDRWTVITADKSPAAHYEYVVAITKQGPIVLTEFKDG